MPDSFPVLLLFGFETGYFRFRDKEHSGRDVAYSTALIFVILVNLVFLLVILPHQCTTFGGAKLCQSPGVCVVF